MSSVQKWFWFTRVLAIVTVLVLFVALWFSGKQTLSRLSAFVQDGVFFESFWDWLSVYWVLSVAALGFFVVWWAQRRWLELFYRDHLQTSLNERGAKTRLLSAKEATQAFVQGFSSDLWPRAVPVRFSRGVQMSTSDDLDVFMAPVKVSVGDDGDSSSAVWNGLAVGVVLPNVVDAGRVCVLPRGRVSYDRFVRLPSEYERFETLSSELDRACSFHLVDPLMGRVLFNPKRIVDLQDLVATSAGRIKRLPHWSFDGQRRLLFVFSVDNIGTSPRLLSSPKQVQSIVTNTENALMMSIKTARIFASRA